MLPVFFSYGPVALSSWVLMLALGACVGFWLTYREAVRRDLEAGPMLLLAVLSFASGVIGARALSWMLHHDLYADRPWWDILIVWDRGGASFYGGLGLAGIVGLAYVHFRRMPGWDAADILAVAWVPSIAVIRVGCFLNGCCYGRPTTAPFGLVAGGAPNNVNFEIPSHPTQLYESAAALVIFAMLWRMRTRRRFAGHLAATFLILYGAFRTGNEFFRGDPRVGWRIGADGFLSLNQLLSATVAGFAVALWLILARRERLRAGPLQEGGAGSTSRPANNHPG